MSEENFSAANIPETNSAVIEQRDHNDNPALNVHKEVAPEAQQEDAKPQTRMQAIEKAAADIEAKNAEKENPKEEDKSSEDDDKELKPKPAKEDKAKAEQQPKADKAEAKDGLVTEKQPKPSEGRRIIEAPDRYLPKAKEVWHAVPHAVREEIEREREELRVENEKYRESHAFREELREYEEMGKKHNISIKQALDNYVDIERKLAQNPHEGFKQILTNMNMQPSDAIVAICQAYGVSPQTLAQHITQSPQSYQPRQTQLTPQQQMTAPVQQQSSTEVDQLRQQVEEMRFQNIMRDVIEPFAKDYPDYYQHEDKIAKVLKSGIIEEFHGSGLSSRDKLEAAYKIVAPNSSRSPVQEESRVENTPVAELRGNPTKSIKGSPSAGLDAPTHKGAKLSRKDAIAAAMAELGVR